MENFLNKKTVFEEMIIFDCKLSFNGKKYIKNIKTKGWTNLDKSTCKVEDVDNFCVLTGKKNGIVVVDIDNKEGTDYFNVQNNKELMDFFKEQNTLVTRSANGGLHLFFKYTNYFLNANYPGVDFLSDGKCVTQGKHYEIIYDNEINVMKREFLSFLNHHYPKCLNLKLYKGEPLIVPDGVNAEKSELNNEEGVNRVLNKLFECNDEWNKINGFFNTYLNKSRPKYCFKCLKNHCHPGQCHIIVNKKEIKVVCKSEGDLVYNVLNEHTGLDSFNHADVAKEFFKWNQDFFVFDKEFNYFEEDVIVPDINHQKIKSLLLSNDFKEVLGLEEKEYKKIKNSSDLTKVLNEIRSLVTKRAVFEPYDYDLKDNEINLFTGFKAEYVPGVKEEQVSKLLDHIKEVICNNDERKYKHFMGWTAYPYQKGRNHTAMVLIGQEGSGKSTVTKLKEQFMTGKKLSTSVSDISLVFGRFNDILLNKIDVTLEEVRSARDDFTLISGKIKDFITSDDINIESKGKRVINIKNHVNLTMISNEHLPVKISPTDRRYTVFKVNNKYAGNVSYFKDLYETCFNKEFGDLFYSYLTDLDISYYNPNMIIKTSEYENMKLESSSVGLFIKNVKNREWNMERYRVEFNYYKINNEDLYDEYKTFYVEQELKNSYKQLCKHEFSKQFVNMFGDSVEKSREGRNKITFYKIKIIDRQPLVDDVFERIGN